MQHKDYTDLFCYEDLVHFDSILLHNKHTIDLIETEPHYWQFVESLEFYYFNILDSFYCPQCWLIVFPTFEFPSFNSYRDLSWNNFLDLAHKDSSWCKKCNSSLFNVKWKQS